MAIHLIKVAYAGLVTTAAKTADPGVTSGGATIYQVHDVPGDVAVDDVIAAFKRFGRTPPKHRDHEVAWVDIAG